MEDFRIGDRVIWRTHPDLGEGTIINIKYSYYSIQFDKHVYGHDAQGFGKDGYCWNISKKELKKVPFTKDILISLI